MRSAGLALLLLLALAAPASAGTSNCIAPPGTAAIEQYCETVPSANGNGGGGARAAQPVDRSTTRALRSQGADGKALATLLTSDGAAQAGGASKPAARTHQTGAGGRTKGGSAAQDEPSQNPLRAVTSAVESGPTLGDGFVWALLGIAALMVAAGWLRLRGRRS